MRSRRHRSNRILTALTALTLVMTMTAVAAGAPGESLTTPDSPMEQPVEVEVETAPGSLKQAPLWKELYQLLEEPYAHPERRPGFGVAMPDLDLWALDYNFLTAEPMRLKPSDGEVSLDQPGALFDPEENIETDVYSVPTEERTVLGALVASEDPVLDPEEIPEEVYRQVIGGLPEGLSAENITICDTAPVPLNVLWSDQTCGYLLVYNPGPLDLNEPIPPNGTIAAVPAWVDTDEGRRLRELEQEEDAEGEPIPWDPIDGEVECNENNPQPPCYEIVEELEAPVNEEDFLRPEEDTRGVPNARRDLVGRPAAEILGKALFWDMQVGSDGVQACASCHFHAGADDRANSQINPGFQFGGDDTYQVAGPNEAVTTDDFPFRKVHNPDGISQGSEETNCGAELGLDPCSDPNLNSDTNDIMSSMGVSEFKQFDDIPEIGTFVDQGSGVAVLPPDQGTDLADPIAEQDGFRRVEPRNTPTFHGAAFNLDNFWDSRARFVFNGGSSNGPSDPQAHVFIDPGNPNGGNPNNPTLQPATNGSIFVDIRGEEEIDDEIEEIADLPVRIKFSSLGSQAVEPPLSDNEMSFHGRNWPKIGKKMLQLDGSNDGDPAATPLANQLVAVDDSVLGPFSNQGGSLCPPGATGAGKPGLCISYNELIELAFAREFWQNSNRYLSGCYTDGRTPSCASGEDPFDNYLLELIEGEPPDTLWSDTNLFTQKEANFSLFFGLSVQAYESLTIPDDTAFDRFMDANPFAVSAIGQAGEQAVLFPTLVPDLVDDGQLNQSAVPGEGVLTLIDADPSTAECDSRGPNGETGFCEEEVLGMDIFMGANLTAALPTEGPGVPGGPENRNPTFEITNDNGDTIQIPVGSNPFARTARCMLCHLGPEQTDHSINISHGLLKGDAEFEFPDPPFVADPGSLNGNQPDIFPVADGEGTVPAPEAPGKIQVVGGLILSEEVTEGMPQDAVEVEPRDFATFDDPDTWWPDQTVAQQRRFSFGDQGIYNIGVRPIAEDGGRGLDDKFGLPLSSSMLTLRNIGGDSWDNGELMANIDPENLEGEDEFGEPIPGLNGFEETGDGIELPDSTGAPSGYDLQSINPGLERCPREAQLPDYLAPWVNCLPAGELHPEVDEMSGMAPNVVTPPTGGPINEFAENLFGADVHCGIYNPELFGTESPNFGWGPVCPNNQSGIAGNLEYAFHGTWPNPNQVLKDGAFKAPPLRNVALTGPYFHTGSYLTLRQVVDFYMRGGDFPETNAAHRDPNIMNIEAQAFGFGETLFVGDEGRPYSDPFDCTYGAGGGLEGTTEGDIQDPLIDDEECGIFGYLSGSFADALPDGRYLYDAMPDTDHALTPEYLTAEQAEEALVAFMIALTDDRVPLEQAPFDHPELFVPLDGKAPENTFGRDGPGGLLALTGQPCDDPEANTDVNCFEHVLAVGAAGRPGIGLGVLDNFLGVLNEKTPGEVDHFDKVSDPNLDGGFAP